jgi:hypothetical protein
LDIFPLIFCKSYFINPLKAELNPICHLLALLGSHHIFHVSVKLTPMLNNLKICWGC